MVINCLKTIMCYEINVYVVDVQIDSLKRTTTPKAQSLMDSVSLMISPFILMFLLTLVLSAYK